MIAARLAAAAVSVLLASSSAHAGDAGDVAMRGGFLLGQALRCGVTEQRLEPSAKLVHDLVVALADTDVELRDAARSFATHLLASVQPTKGEPVPSCTMIRRELVVFEHHHVGGASPQAVLGQADAHLPTRRASIRREENLL